MGFRERIAELYFRPKAFEFGGRIYQWLGVVPFKRLLLRYAQPKGSYHLKTHDLAAVAAYGDFTRHSEIVHLLAMAPSAFLLLTGIVDSPAIRVLLIVVVAINFHPFILQRYTRNRIQRVLDKSRVRPVPPG